MAPPRAVGAKGNAARYGRWPPFRALRRHGARPRGAA